MKLYEYEGKELFQKYGILVPRCELILPETMSTKLSFPLYLKSQVLVGDRKRRGGVIRIARKEEFLSSAESLFALPIDGQLPKKLLAEEEVEHLAELYVSFSYSTRHRSPVLALSPFGGSHIQEAHLTPLSILEDISEKKLDTALHGAGILGTPEIKKVIHGLWKLFREEGVLVAEINPLFITKAGATVAGDAKVERDDSVAGEPERPFVTLGGDIAVIASGGGASMLNIDILMRAGGKPANYVEYSGNPPASVVEGLTLKVLSQTGLRGVWVVGGTANFTDIYETMSGFVAGLKKISPKPTYPIVIRRDGPNQAEAKIMIEKVAKEGEYNMHVYGPECSMAESARRLVEFMQ